MAVRLADFYNRHYAKYLAIAVALQATLAIFICGSAWLLYRAQLLQGEMLIIVAGLAFMLIEIAVITLTLRLFGQPLRILSDAITHVSKQANDTPPPNVNSAAFERSGLKALVQTVYELSVASFQGPAGAGQGQGSDSNSTMFKEIISLLPCEVIILDKHSNVSFYQGSGGLTQLPNESMKLRLNFTPEDEFERWLETCRQSKVRDTMMWKHVPNAVLGSDEDRKIYDVIAHYEKTDSDSIETVITLIDRTVDYARGEDDIDFITLAAHELREPITIIRGYLDVLQNELASKLEGDQKELLARVQVSSERLNGYINNILNVSKYDRAHLKLHLREEKITDIINSIADDVALRASTQHRTLTYTVPGDLPTVAADASSFSEVIVNLIDNAIKYSKDGGEVVISSKVNGNFVELSVQDAGIGMPANVVSDLFNKFYRSHRSRQAVTGMGLGLYISKAIVESHGGKIWATSVEGQGSTFGVMLPIYATVAEKLKAGDNGNENIIESNNGWIKNHSMYRG